MKENKKVMVIGNLLYGIICIICSIILLFTREYKGVIQCLLFILLIGVYYICNNKLKIKFNSVTIILSYVLAVGALLGTYFDFYTLISWFDLFLHFLSGIIFTSIGIDISNRLFNNENVVNKYVICLLFGVMFSFSIALVWELVEYGGSLLGFDMQEDSIINSFNSYLLSGTHLEIFEVNNITQTIIYYGDNKVLTINGYLDIGLLDTIYDMLICFIGTVLYAIGSCFNRFIINNKNNNGKNNNIVLEV